MIRTDVLLVSSVRLSVWPLSDLSRDIVQVVACTHFSKS